MKKNLLLILSVLIGLINTNAQTTTPKRNCGSDKADAYRMANDPDYRAGRLAFEQKVQTWIAEHPNYDAKGTVVTIPVVVHVIYNTSVAAEKLTITQVNEQLAYTNADYAGTNPHSMNAFPSSLKANAGVQFCLAKVDPSGNSTTGIDYKQTTVNGFNNISGSSASCSGYPERCASTGGADAWDVTKYLNIWTCDGGTTGLCGISEFPTSPNNKYYGTTIDYHYFGHTGASTPYNLGGTYTHEAGHCLNLFHTWGDDNGACTGTDNVADTPNQADMYYGSHEGGDLAENGGTGTTATMVTDACTTTSPGNLYEDFMDYTDDIDYACFTPGQVTRIKATLAAMDLSLTTSTKCSGVGIEESEFNNSVIIYPNPSKNEFTIDFSGFKYTDASIEVCNIIGKIVKNISTNSLSNKIVIDLSNEDSGIYFVNIKTPEGTVVRKLSLIK